MAVALEKLVLVTAELKLHQRIGLAIAAFRALSIEGCPPQSRGPGLVYRVAVEAQREFLENEVGFGSIRTESSKNHFSTSVGGWPRRIEADEGLHGRKRQTNP